MIKVIKNSNSVLYTKEVATIATNLKKRYGTGLKRVWYVPAIDKSGESQDFGVIKAEIENETPTTTLLQDVVVRNRKIAFRGEEVGLLSLGNEKAEVRLPDGQKAIVDAGIMSSRLKN